jgi:hypothetical protein
MHERCLNRSIVAANTLPCSSLGLRLRQDCRHRLFLYLNVAGNFCFLFTRGFCSAGPHHTACINTLTSDCSLQTVHKAISDQIAVAVRINKARGLTLKRVVIYPPFPAFFFLLPVLCDIFLIFFLWHHWCNYWMASTRYREWHIGISNTV